MKALTAIIGTVALVAMIASATQMLSFPPQASASPEPECHPNPEDGFDLWANKNISIGVTPVDIDYDTCTWMGPIIDTPGPIHVNSTQNGPNNDAYTKLKVSAGHLSEIHRWYLIKNPTDYDLQVKLMLNEHISRNIEKIIELELYIGGEPVILVFNGTVENNTVSFVLHPLETKEIDFRVSMALEGKTSYTAFVSLSEYIEITPHKDI